MNLLQDKHFTRFVVKFLLLFALFYGGTYLVIGLAAPGGLYSSFIEHYFDYVSWLKYSLMKGAAVVASFFGYQTIEEPGFLVRVVKARGVIVAYDCVGYGVLSFWAAFILANKIHFRKKLAWLLVGLLLLWAINVLRIGLFLVAINKKWAMPLGWDHHTWFNIFAYTAIFIMIWLFDRNSSSTTNES